MERLAWPLIRSALTTSKALIRWKGIWTYAGGRQTGQERWQRSSRSILTPANHTPGKTCRAKRGIMSDIAAAPPAGARATAAIKLPGLGEVGAFMKRGGIALAVGVLTISSC
jgi:hypothetical protein